MNSPDSNSSSIDCLNDVCLIKIFEYLTIKEKINIEGVCRNWNRVSKMAWDSTRSIDLSSILPYKYDIDYFVEDEFKKRKENFLMILIKRCGYFLKNIKIYISQSALLPDAFTKILVMHQYLTNLSEINLHDDCRNHFFTDEHLNILFSKNPEISSIHLSEFSINGDCLLRLDKNRIKEIGLHSCKFKSSENFHIFLSQLKNLSKLKICQKQPIEIINSLITGDCKNLIELDIYQRMDDEPITDNLLIYLKNQEIKMK